jgi:flagellar basal-body rod modification protein FlgD
MTTPIGAGGSPPTTTTDTSSGAAFAPSQLGEQAFLQLLIAELQNQDPNQPMDGQQMITQLAQLNQTQATIESATYQQEGFASSLIGQTVTGTANGKPLTGIVAGFTENNGTVTLNVADQAMNVSSVTQVGTGITTSTPPGTTSTGGQG